MKVIKMDSNYSNVEILADTISSLSNTIQLFMQSAIYHLDLLEIRINDINDKIRSAE